jgi:hypothetical protein
LCGHLFVDLGRVVPDYESLFENEEWRVGGGGGLIIGSTDSQILRMDLSFSEEGFQFFLSTSPLRAFESRDEQL